MGRVRQRLGVDQSCDGAGTGPMGRWRRARSSSGGRRGASGVRDLAVVPRPCAAQQGLGRDGRALRRACERARAAGDEGEREEARRGDARGGAAGYHAPPLRSPSLDRYRNHRRGRPRAVVQHLRGAGRRRRSDRSLELTGRAAGPLARSRSRGREHGRGEDAGADGARRELRVTDHRRSRLAAAGGDQHLHRVGQHGRPVPRRLARHPGRQLHGQHHCRATGRSQRRADAEAHEPGARRQNADDRLRGRRPRKHDSAAHGPASPPSPDSFA